MRITFTLLIIAISLSACATHGSTSEQADKLPHQKTAASPVMTTSAGLKIVPTFRAKPIYPQREANRGIQGCVNVIFQLDAQGHPTHLQARASAPNGVFDVAAIRTVSQWRFRVTDRQGHSATAGTEKIDQVMIFSLSLYGSTPHSTSIIKWICFQPPPRTLVVESATANKGLHVAEARDKNRWVDVVHMPNPHDLPLKNGWVDVGFCIDKKGQVTHIDIRDSSPKGLYDKAAIAALKTWSFTARTLYKKTYETCGLSYHIPVIGAAALARGPAVLNQRLTAIPARDLDIPLWKTPTEHHVTLRFCIGKDGSVSGTKVVGSQPDKTFDQAALKMLHVWPYWPKTVNGMPLRSCNVQETIVFKLGNSHLLWAYPATP